MGWPAFAMRLPAKCHPLARRLRTGQSMTSIDPTNWHGTQDELRLLRSAFTRHCACPSNDGDAPGYGACSAHAMMDDQRTLDHLVFAYRVRNRYTRGEWDAEPAEDLPAAA